jgi:hypothetical protein
VVLGAATTSRRCQLAEAADSQILNRETEKPFTFGDACVEKGPTIAFDDAANTQARTFVREFLAEIFKLK